jgi:hypothetical protein
MLKFIAIFEAYTPCRDPSHTYWNHTEGITMPRFTRHDLRSCFSSITHGSSLHSLSYHHEHARTRMHLTPHVTNVLAYLTQINAARSYPWVTNTRIPIYSHSPVFYMCIQAKIRRMLEIKIIPMRRGGGGEALKFLALVLEWCWSVQLLGDGVHCPLLLHIHL